MHSREILISLLLAMAVLAVVTKRFLVVQAPGVTVEQFGRKRILASFAVAGILVLLVVALVALMIYVFYFEP